MGIISDIHMGHGEGERYEDPFDAFEEALELCKDCDFLLLPGDIFDSRTPLTETITRAAVLLAKAGRKDSGVKILEKDTNLRTPIIAIHGTHERRSKGLLNPVEALDKMGFLIHLHCNYVVLEKGGEKVCIQGLSAVPEQFSEKVVKEWAPKPVPNCKNVFFLHQSIAGFLYAEHLLLLESLPKGFDLYVNGHIHEPKEATCHGAPFIIPGSLVHTQVTSTTKPARVYKVDLQNMKIWWEELQNQRKFYYKAFEGADPKEVENYLKEILDEPKKEMEADGISFKAFKKPLIKIKIKRIPTDELMIKFGDKAFISFGFEKEEIETKTLEEHVLSVKDMGKQLLKDNLKEAGIEEWEPIFELLLNKKQEEVIKMLEK